MKIITKKGSGPATGYSSQEVGNYDTYRAKAGVSGAWKAFDYSLGYYHLESNGLTINDGMNQNAVAGRFGLDLPWGNTRLSAAVRYNKTDTGVPIEFVGTPLPIVPTIDPNTHQESETYTATVDLRTRPVTWWEGEIRASRYWNKQSFIDPPDPFTCPPATFGPPCDFPGTFQTDRNEVEALSHFHLGKWSTSTFGIEWREEQANVQGTSAFSPYSRTWSGFFQQQFRFFDRLFMAAGVRVEDNNNFGMSTTERGSLAYVVKEWGSRLHGSAGSGFRAPTFNDLFFPGFSNPNLTPETSFSWDVGVDQKLWGDRISLGVTYFHNKFNNLITCCVPLATFPFATTANIGRARSKGVEVVSQVVILDNLVATFNYTYTDTENLDTGRPLPREPNNRYNGSLTWEPIKRLSLFSEIQIVIQPVRAAGEPHQFRTHGGQPGRILADPRAVGPPQGARFHDADPERVQRAVPGGPRLPGARHQRPGRIAGDASSSDWPMTSIEGVEIEIDEEAVVVTAAAPLTVLSSAVQGGGLGHARAIVNLRVDTHCPWEDAALRLDAFAARRGVPSPRVGLLDRGLDGPGPGCRRAGR